MLTNIGVPGLILILVIALVIFGPKKLPEIGRAFGSTLKEFKSATKGLVSDNEEEEDKRKPKLEVVSLEKKKEDKTNIK